VSGRSRSLFRVQRARKGCGTCLTTGVADAHGRGRYTVGGLVAGSHQRSFNVEKNDEGNR
jgi:hypothetical protein